MSGFQQNHPSRKNMYTGRSQGKQSLKLDLDSIPVSNGTIEPEGIFNV